MNKYADNTQEWFQEHCDTPESLLEANGGYTYCDFCGQRGDNKFRINHGSFHLINDDEWEICNNCMDEHYG